MNNVVYFVPHTHYDAVWAFTKEDYFYINIELILRKTVDLIEKSEYKFLIEQTVLIEEIERRNPLLFRRITQLIKEGRIEIADGEYLMADNILPNGEVLIRQILTGKRYVKEKFGIDVLVMWSADSFGYNAQFPQILRKCGYRYFTCRRGVDKNKPSEFWWQALDGTRILAHWMPLGYRAGLDLDTLDESFNKLRDAAATKNILMPSGSGSTPPQPEALDAVKKWNRTHKDSKMIISKSLDFFEALEKQSNNLEVRSGELYSGRYSEIFPSVTSSRIWIKQKLRNLENMLLSCEKWAAVAWLLGIPYPSDEFGDNWKKILWATSHDIAPGTGMDEAYVEARENFAHLEDRLPETLSDLLSFISHSLRENADIIVFNPLTWKVTNWVEVELFFKLGEVKKIEGLRTDQEEQGVEVLQFTRYADDSYQTAKIGFVATVPPLGYRTYKIMSRSPRSSKKPKISIEGNSISNQFFSVKVDPSNGMIEVLQDGKWIARGNELVLEEEIGDLYYHRQHLEQAFKTERDEGVRFGKFKIKQFKINKTHLRRIIEIESDYFSLRWPYRIIEKTAPRLLRHNYLSLKKKIIIYEDIPRIDFVTEVENRHPQIRLRVKFSTDIDSKEYQSETQFGVVSRPIDQYHFKPEEKWVEDPCGIFPALNWIDYSDGKKGVTLINKGLPGNEIRDKELYLTLLRSVLMLSSDGETGPAIPTPDAQEFKTYQFEYSLFPHKKDWRAANSFKPAYEFNQNLIGLQIPSEPQSKDSKLPTSLSFVELEPDNLILSALKKAEDTDEIVLRFFETKGERTSGILKFFKKPIYAKRVSLLETDEEVIQFEGTEIKLEVKPFEIVSLELKF